MKTVVICGSKRFKTEIRDFASALEKLGVIVYEPHLCDIKPRDWEKIPEDQRNFISLGLVYDHFQKIRQADFVYIYNGAGYIGNSVTMEMGYAAALGKTIFAYDPDTSEITRNVLIREIIKTPEELYSKLK